MSSEHDDFEPYIPEDDASPAEQIAGLEFALETWKKQVTHLQDENRQLRDGIAQMAMAFAQHTEWVKMRESRI